MFQKRWKTLISYGIWELEFGRYIDEQHYVPYLNWVASGNTAPNASGDRFILIDTNGVPYEDPNKDAILKKELEGAQMPDIEERIARLEALLLELGLS